jgi:hypothetical protein
LTALDGERSAMQKVVLDVSMPLDGFFGEASP